MALDALLTVGALHLAVILRLSVPAGEYIAPTYHLPLAVTLIACLVWVGTFLLFAVYDPRRTYRFVDELQQVITGSLFALLVLAGALYFSERLTSRLLVGYFFVLDLTALIGWRVVWRIMRRLAQRHPVQRVIIIGANPFGAHIAKMLTELSHDQALIVGFLDDAPAAEDMAEGMTVIGRIDQVAAIVVAERIDEVIVTLPYSAYDRLHTIIPALQTQSVQIRIAPNYVNLALHRARVEEFGGLAFVNLRDPALTPSQRLAKRAFDLALCLLLLPILIPIMAFIAALIRLDSRGAAFYHQERVGENGRLFKMIKFRTMIVGADRQKIVGKTPDDPRITRIGRFLRRTSLDELPQMMNVLRGEMSLVGPRPEMPWLVEQYEPWQRKRFAVPQGMTGWWQVNGRASRPMHQHTEDDLYYIQNYSILLDVIILWKTIFAVISRRGAF